MTALGPSKLTVRIIRRTLGDHFLDFMNVNNPNGFEQDVDREIDDTTLSGAVMLTALLDYVTVKRANQQVKLIRNLSKRVIKVSQAYDILGTAFGYENWGEAKAAAVDGIVTNRRLLEAQRSNVAQLAHGTVVEGIDLRQYAAKGLPLPEGYVLMENPAGIQKAWESWYELRDKLARVRIADSREMDNFLLQRIVNTRPGLVVAFQWRGQLVYASYRLLKALAYWRKKHPTKISNGLALYEERFGAHHE